MWNYNLQGSQLAVHRPRLEPVLLFLFAVSLLRGCHGSRNSYWSQGPIILSLAGAAPKPNDEASADRIVSLFGSNIAGTGLWHIAALTE